VSPHSNGETAHSHGTSSSANETPLPNDALSSSNEPPKPRRGNGHAVSQDQIQNMLSALKPPSNSTKPVPTKSPKQVSTKPPLEIPAPYQNVEDGPILPDVWE